MKEKILTLKLLKDKYGVCRLDTTSSVPEWGEKGEFFSVTRTSDEMSIVCSEKNIPENIKCEKNWRILKIEGPLDFSLIGILASISSILAERKISIFAVSTYDTDYILIRDADVNNAVEALSEQKYNIV
ncbi:ACT domain-containing protein [Clostridium tyrobutyricum]|uniref:ACT domain-containing protein n=1 Tax=Clostridium tyrobutyricum TaxID=1519 RepID=UPI001C389D5A|nr:ACT domain-containing protein [Clostridium tyrobutyricum]MBV4418459.1 ACT domain-containing protein [Clostridium tyrobutyricum]